MNTTVPCMSSFILLILSQGQEFFTCKKTPGLVHSLIHMTIYVLHWFLGLSHLEIFYSSLPQIKFLGPFRITSFTVKRTLKLLLILNCSPQLPPPYETRLQPYETFLSQQVKSHTRHHLNLRPFWPNLRPRRYLTWNQRKRHFTSVIIDEVFNIPNLPFQKFSRLFPGPYHRV